MTTMPAVVPMPSSRSRPRSLRTRATSVIAPCRFDVRTTNDEQRADHDDVVQDRRERGRDEAIARVQQRAGQGREAVEDHLRDEAEDQDRQDVQLRGAVRPVVAQHEQRARAAARAASRPR